MSSPGIELVPFGREHFDQLIAWSPTAEFLLQWAGPSFRYPLDHDQLEELLRSPALLFTVVAGGAVVGHAEIGRIDEATASAWLMRILVGDPGDRRRGLGRAIVRRLVEICFLEVGVHRVYLHVLEANQVGIDLYRSMGFEPCDPVLTRPESIQTMVLMRTKWNPAKSDKRDTETDIDK